MTEQEEIKMLNKLKAEINITLCEKYINELLREYE